VQTEIDLEMRRWRVVSDLSDADGVT
jgi:hypothetical protein